MCADKHEFLAGRLEQALSRYGGAEKDTVCRILGCCSRIACARIRDIYLDRYKRSLDDDLRAKVNQGNYLAALLTLTSGDTQQTPLGSDKELGEDEADNAKEGARQRDFFAKSYKDAKTIERGLAELCKNRKSKPKTLSRTENPSFQAPSFKAPPGAEGAASSAASFFSTVDEDDEELGIHFEVGVGVGVLLPLCAACHVLIHP